VIDLAEVGPDLLDRGAESIRRLVDQVVDSDIAVFASPTYKASYTGLLKLFLDQIPTMGLSEIAAVPLMLGAGPAHAMAPEVFLKPVLVELGATCPTSGLYLQEQDHLSDDRISSWVVRARPQLGIVGA
jgi:FMN reductase